MDAKAFGTFVGYSAGFGWLYYIVTSGLEYYNKDKLLENVQNLDDELLDKMVDILSEAKIEKNRKYKYNFVENKDNYEFINFGKFSMFDKLIALPTNFTIKDDTKLDEFLIKLNNKFKDKDFLKHKDLFKFTDKELEFAILFEIYRSNYDLRIIDSCFISFFGITVINFTSLFIKDTKLKIFIASTLYLMSIICYFWMRGRLFDEYSIGKILSSKDLELMESGLKYLNKRIQLNEFLGKNTSNLKNQFNIIENECKNLKKLNIINEQQSSQNKADIEFNEKLRMIRERKREETKQHLKKISNVSSTI